MRALLAAVLLLTLPAVPAAAALLPPACTDGTTTTGASFAWNPSCLRIASGDIITFGNADEIAPHNARSSQDTNVAIPGTIPCFQTADLELGETAQVRFTHDGDGVTASVRQSNGSWGPARDCSLAEDLLTNTLDANEAAIPFECGIHQSMTGTIRIVKLG